MPGESLVLTNLLFILPVIVALFRWEFLLSFAAASAAVVGGGYRISQTQGGEAALHNLSLQGGESALLLFADTYMVRSLLVVIVTHLLVNSPALRTLVRWVLQAGVTLYTRRNANEAHVGEMVGAIVFVGVAWLFARTTGERHALRREWLTATLALLAAGFAIRTLQGDDYHAPEYARRHSLWHVVLATSTFTAVLTATHRT